jgi:hypothetical protein
VGGQAGDGVAGLGRPRRGLVQWPAAAPDLDGLGGVGEGDPGGHRGGVEGAPLGPAMAFLPGVEGGPDLPPGQALQLRVQAGLVVLRCACIASAVMTAAAMSIRSSSTGNMGISFVLAPTSAWPKTTP